MKIYYNKNEPIKFNCARLIYIEHAIKNNTIEKSVKLANCFVNMYTINSVYNENTKKEIIENCPTLFKNGIRIPDYYMILVKELINK